MAKDDKDLVSKPDPLESKLQPGGFFNLSSTAKEKVRKKRKKKGLGEQKPKALATSTQLFVGWTSAIVAKAALTPIERIRAIMQVDHLATNIVGVKNQGSLGLFASKHSDLFNF